MCKHLIISEPQMILQMILQISMPKLIYGTHLAEKSEPVGVIKKCHQAPWQIMSIP
jgi:hypothetical protein